MSEKYGIYAVTPNDNKRHEIDLLKTNERNKHIPEVQKILIKKYFTKNAKGRYKEEFIAESENTG
jgi:hypothetical protein